MSNSSVSETIRIVSRSLMPVIIFLGLLGNLCAVYILTRSFRRKFPSHTFLAALAAVDTGFLLALFTEWLGHLTGFKVIQDTQVGCKMFMFITYTTDLASEWLIVCISMERFLVLFYPSLRHQLCTVRNARILTAIVLVVSVVFCTWTLVISESIPHGHHWQCAVDSTNLKAYIFLNATDTILSCFLPSVLVVCLNIVMVYNLQRYYRPMTTVTRGLTQVIECANAPNSLFLQLHQQQINRYPDSQLTRSLIVVTSTFVILKIPSYVIRILSISELEVPHVAVVVSLMLYYLHHAISFYMYTFLGPGMRGILWKTWKSMCISVLTCEFLEACCSCDSDWESY